MAVYYISSKSKPYGTTINRRYNGMRGMILDILVVRRGRKVMAILLENFMRASPSRCGKRAYLISLFGGLS